MATTPCLRIALWLRQPPSIRCSSPLCEAPASSREAFAEAHGQVNDIIAELNAGTRL
jgi:hypothetical protein